MKAKAKRITSVAVAAVMALSMFTGCDSASSQETAEAAAVIDTATKEIRLNDYRGGVKRTLALQEKVLNIVEGMKRNNTVVREENPNGFWNTSGYQDFVSTFLTAPIITDCQWLNEEQTEWSSAVAALTNRENSFTVSDGEGGYTKKYSSMSTERNEKDDYTITGVSGSLKGYSGSLTYRILYDCDKDWCKAYSTMSVSKAIPDVTVEMFEYARLNKDTFVIQTATERLLIVLEPTETDTDIRERTIKEFYYSRLSGGIRTSFVPYEPLPEYEEGENGEEKAIKENIKRNETMGEIASFNEYGDYSFQYGKNNSIFLDDNIASTNHSWVFEDGALQQAMVYKNETLIVTTYNKLSEKYERFIYSVNAFDEKLIAEAERMVNIEGLVGVITEETYSPTETTVSTATSEEKEPTIIDATGNTLAEGDVLVPVLEANISDDIDLSTVTINNAPVNITGTVLSDILSTAGIKHCSYGSTILTNDAYSFTSGMFGIQKDETDIMSFGGTMVSVEVLDESGNVVAPAHLEEKDFAKYRVVGVHSSEFFTHEDFEVIYYSGIKSGMTKDELYSILGEGTVIDGRVIYKNSTHTLAVEIESGEVDEITLFNNNIAPAVQSPITETTPAETTAAETTTTTAASSVAVDTSETTEGGEG